MEGLNNSQQAFLMLLVFILPSLSVWAGLGMPTDKAAIGILLSAMISGIIAFIKEILGGKAPTSEGDKK